MSDLDAQVAGIKKRIAEAQSARAKAETQAEVARDRVRQAEQAMLSEFGVGPEEAAERIRQLETDLAAEAKRVREALERAEASE
jgi:hypothetical protein